MNKKQKVLLSIYAGWTLFITACYLTVSPTPSLNDVLGGMLIPAIPVVIIFFILKDYKTKKEK